MFITRLNDSGQGYCVICECYVSVRVITGSGTVLSGALPVAKFNDVVQGACGHTASIISSAKNRVNSLPVSRMGDMFVGIVTGNLITGSPDVLSQ